jgi:hypothetical protein
MPLADRAEPRDHTTRRVTRISQKSNTTRPRMSQFLIGPAPTISGADLAGRTLHDCGAARSPAYRSSSDSSLEGDGFELSVRERRVMAPSHGFAAASHREAALRGAPASHGETAFRGAAGFREACRRHAVHPSRNAVLWRRAGRPLSVARRVAMRSGHCEIRPGENVTLQYLSHDGPRPPSRTSRG